MGLIQFDQKRTRQPQGAVRLNQDHPLASRIIGTLWSTRQTFGDQLGWSQTGTIGPSVNSGGVGVKGDGTTGHLSRSINVAAVRPHILLTVHQEATASTTLRAIYALGSASASFGATVYIASGTGAASNIFSQHRATDGGIAESATGPSVVSGQVYASSTYIRSVVASNNKLYVNGSAYNFATDPDGAGSTLVYESVGALKRGAISNYSADTLLFSGRFVPLITDDWQETLLQWTKEPWRLFEPKRVLVPVTAASGPPTLAAIAASNLTASGARLTVTV